MELEPSLDWDAVRRTAYFLWEQDGRPDDRSEYYWFLAIERVAREKANDALLNGYAGTPNIPPSLP